VAAAIGVGAAWFVMTPGAREPDDVGAAPGPPPGAAPIAADPGSGAPPGPEPPAVTGPEPRDASAIDGELVAPDPQPNAPPEPPVVPADAALPPPVDAPLRHHAPLDGGGRRRPPTDPAQPAPSDPAASTAAAPSPEPDPPSLESLSRLFHSADYAAVVRMCSATPMKPEIMNVCAMAACQERNAALATRWLAAGDAAKREQLTAYCKKYGIEIAKSLDCSKNPADCQ
jgi:hypothetical protein